MEKFEDPKIIIKIAQGQRLLIYAIIACLLLSGISEVIPGIWMLGSLVAMSAVFNLTRLIGGQPVIMAISALVPLLNLLVLLNVNMGATSVLRKNGIKISLMGASKKELDKFRQASTIY